MPTVLYTLCEPTACMYSCCINNECGDMYHCYMTLIITAVLASSMLFFGIVFAIVRICYISKLIRSHQLSVPAAKSLEDPTSITSHTINMSIDNNVQLPFSNDAIKKKLKSPISYIRPSTNTSTKNTSKSISVKSAIIPSNDAQLVKVQDNVTPIANTEIDKEFEIPLDKTKAEDSKEGCDASRQLGNRLFTTKQSTENPSIETDFLGNNDSISNNEAKDIHSEVQSVELKMNKHCKKEQVEETKQAKTSINYKSSSTIQVNMVPKQAVVSTNDDIRSMRDEVDKPIDTDDVLKYKSAMVDGIECISQENKKPKTSNKITSNANLNDIDHIIDRTVLHSTLIPGNERPTTGHPNTNESDFV